MEEKKPGCHGLRLLLDALAGEPGSTDGTHAACRMRWNRQFNQLVDAVVLGREGFEGKANEAVAEALEATAPT
ncbi:hypothetical protein OG943_10075 [Amycolatopsis sp. NBC_00345]|uniref:hypothetical protein n=1 Tax=Amycolatopsis sp. NBC_00345 TaxID=2975955 RepID=UPI002E267328